DHTREHLPQPRPAGEDILIGRKAGFVRERERPHFATLNSSRRHTKLAIFSALGQKMFQHRLTIAARRKKSAVALVDRPLHLFEIDLRETLARLGRAQLLE